VDKAANLLLELGSHGTISVRRHTAAMGASDPEPLTIAIRIIT
jgi:hypothetical protein